MCAITGMPARVSSSTWGAISAPPSSLTACALASFMNRTEVWKACSADALVGAERQVGDDERATDRAGHRTRQRDELVDGDRQGGLVAVDVVRGGVADEQHRDAGLVEGGRGVHVVGGEHRPLLAALLHLAQVVGAHPLHRLHRVRRTRWLRCRTAQSSRSCLILRTCSRGSLCGVPGPSSSVDPARADATCVVAHCPRRGPGTGRLGPVDFYSAYAQGFARVAACTVPTVDRRPAANARAVLAQARACHEEGVAVAIFPELCLTGYAIDDLLLQETLLDEVEDGDRRDRRGVRRPAAGARRRGAAAQPAPALQLRGRDPPRPGPRRRAQGRTCRTTASSTSGATSPRATTRPAAASSRSAGRTCPSVPTCCSAPSTCRAWCCTWRSARTCGCRSRRAPTRRSRARRCSRTSPARPITVARAEDRRLLVRSASARCLAAYLYAAAGQGESSTDLSWDGQTMVYEVGDLLGESERFPDGPGVRRSTST